MEKENENTPAPVNREALDAIIKERDTALGKVKEGETRITSLTERLTSLETEFGSAVSAYAGAVLRANPTIPAELVTGASINEVNASLAKATALVGKIRQSMSQEQQTVTVPAGAPGRTPPDTSAMSTREKITAGIQNKRKEK